MNVLTGVLRDYDYYLWHHVAPCSLSTLEDDRKEAKMKYKEDGDLRQYFDVVGKVRAREAELPLVTFGVLDQLIESLRGDVPCVDNEVTEELERVARAGGQPQEWTD